MRSFPIDSSLFCRTLLDLSIGILHIVSHVAESAQKDDAGCKILGALLQFALFASSGWYVTLAAELFFLIRNPFRCVMLILWAKIVEYTCYLESGLVLLVL